MGGTLPPITLTSNQRVNIMSTSLNTNIDALAQLFATQAIGIARPTKSGRSDERNTVHMSMCSDECGRNILTFKVTMQHMHNDFASRNGKTKKVAHAY